MRATTPALRGINAAVVAVLAGASVASAASPPITTQAAAANAAFLAYAPPPAGGAKALCLVDTGVNATPDTAPGLLSTTAVDGGTGADADPLLHGTIDAAIAGGAGHGVLGAWPRLKIASVRATDAPSPGQAPTYQFDDYTRGINECIRVKLTGVDVAGIALPLSSVIPPTPDQVDDLAAMVSQAQTRGIAILVAAGNSPGPTQQPGSQPGVLPVGAGDASNGICPFSASTGLTFFAPGCGLDQINTAGDAFCCGNGTSQAASFAAAVLVAMRSYSPGLTGARAAELLVSTAKHGHLDATAAFRAAGLGAIVDSGISALPKPAPVIAPPSVIAMDRVPKPGVKRAVWRRGVLLITLNTISAGARVHARVTFARGKARFLSTTTRVLRARTRQPRRVVLHQSRNGVRSGTVTVKVIRTQR